MAQGAPNSAATRWMPGRINSVLSVGAFQALKTQPRQPAQAVTSVPRPSSPVASMCSGQPPSASSAARKAGDCFRFDVRPTPDLVRQAVFNSLGARVEDARVLELFAGTGALSLECLSRGAVRAVCVEKSDRHAGFLRRNLATAQLDAALLDVRVQDAFTALA